MTVRAVFFDAAGTLIEPREPVGATYARIARDYGIDADGSAVNSAFRRVFRDMPPLAFGPDRDAAELRSLEYRWWRDLVAASFTDLGEFTDFEGYFRQLFAFFADPSKWRLDPQAKSMLDSLHERGFALGLISNFDHRLYRILEVLELRSYFATVTISSEAGYAKPSPEIFEIALQKHGLAAGETIHVGDSPELDVVGARAARIAAILIDPNTIARCHVENGVARISSLHAVPEAIDQLAFP